jgi:hypothetical protein
MSYHLHLKADIQDQKNMNKMEAIKQTHKHTNTQTQIRTKHIRKTQMQTQTQRQTHSIVKISSHDSLLHKHTSKQK